MENDPRLPVAEVRRWHHPAYLLATLALAAALALALAAWLPAQANAERDPQIIGGISVPNGKYPFMVSLQDRGERIRGFEGHFCGGTLIDEDSVLTAAHCTDFIGANTTFDADGRLATLSFRDLRIVVGRTVLTSGQGQVRRVSRLSDVKVHPRFASTRRGLVFDATVIQLNRPVRGIEPMGLDAIGSDRSERPGSRATIAGWGNIIQQGPASEMPDKSPNRMRETGVPLVSDARAEAAYEPKGIRYVPSIMVSAGKSGRDTCQGDSGGPLFVKTRGGFRQVGITSFGIGCGTAIPGVYAEVSSPPIGRFIRAAAGD